MTSRIYDVPEYDIWAIVLDETEYLGDFEGRDRVKSVGMVYVFDRNRHVYACEMTPSYELWPVQHTIVFTDEVYNTIYDNEDWDMENWRNEFEYQMQGYMAWENVTYVHTRSIDKMIVRGNKNEVEHILTKPIHEANEDFGADDEIDFMRDHMVSHAAEYDILNY